MNKRAQEDWKGILFIILILIGLFALNSSNLCDKTLLLLSVFFGSIWLFTGEAFYTKTVTRGFKAFLPISIVLFIIWLLLRVSGACTPLTEIISGILEVLK